MGGITLFFLGICFICYGAYIHYTGKVQFSTKSFGIRKTKTYTREENPRTVDLASKFWIGFGIYAVLMSFYAIF